MKNKVILVAKAILAGIGIGKNIDNNRWIFSSTDNEQYNYNSKYLFEYVKEHVEGITPCYVINDAKKRKHYQDVYGEQYFVESSTIKGMRNILKSGVWFTSAGLPVYKMGLKRQHNIINLWHGVPLKKIGLLDCNLNGISRKYFKKIFSDNYKYVITTSEKLIPIMSESFDVSENKVKVWGQPRNDGIFAYYDRKEILNNLYCNLPEYDNIILYAPTFRDKGKTELFPFADFDLKELEKFLEKNKTIIFIRSHIEDFLKENEGKTERIRFINSDKVGDVTAILSIFDLLITDYSSIYIDYLLTERPILFLPYDKEEYLKNRGMNFEYDEVTPGPKPESMKSFMENIEELLGGEDKYVSARKKINTFFNEIQHPCSRNICEKIISELGICAKINRN